MRYKIVADTSCELPGGLLEDERFELVPFGMEIDGVDITDDPKIDIKDLVDKIAKSPTCPKSSCPAPQAFLDAFDTDASRIYVITISDKLSGSYNSAVLAKSMYEEHHGEDHKEIFVIDSESASCGESQLAVLAMELEEQGLPFEEIQKRLIEYRDTQHTYFILDNLETLRKNGRMSGVKALVASTLSIKPIMAGNHGAIVQKGQCVGMKKALAKMVDMAADDMKEFPEGHRRVYITQCNNPERAEYVRKLFLERTPAEEVVVMATYGLSSLYANDGGIIVTF